ncbi:MAG: SDR family oxidoreductase [Gammaproteobacteria bacterium]|nr:SDR family oxidoreductase [Gammaproteobacteria bacterium]MDD9894630.1 SDR family oxidoreductase [Gammaproteobacteria bacterium]MDD9959970.1 SDR family oxidoreductase [Gammaproteobacteria bacterium]
MKILLIGATSAIAKAVARIYAERHASFYLLARNEERLKELADDLIVRGAAAINSQVLDLTDTTSHAEVIQNAHKALEELDIALICHGTLPDQESCESDFAQAEKALNVNGLSVVSLCTEVSKILKVQGSGTLAVITSVAGDRGRQPNFVYGAAKSMVSTYLQGLRGKLLPYNVHVIDIRPGLVDSPMTAGFEKGPLWSTPELVAGKVVRSIDSKKHTVYVPGYWRIIMAFVASIPEFIFKRLKI